MPSSLIKNNYALSFQADLSERVTGCRLDLRITSSELSMAGHAQQSKSTETFDVEPFPIVN